MQNLDINKVADAWSLLAGAVFVPYTDEEYRRLVAILDHLIDEVREDESYPTRLAHGNCWGVNREIRR